MGNIHLYIEKYAKKSKELLLDFVDEEEFACFLNESGLPDIGASQILVHNFSTEKPIKNDTLISVDTKAFAELCKQEAGNKVLPSTVLVEVQNGASLDSMIS